MTDESHNAESCPPDETDRPCRDEPGSFESLGRMLDRLAAMRWSDCGAECLDYVRRHPVQGLTAGLLAGFFVGRFFRRP